MLEMLRNNKHNKMGAMPNVSKTDRPVKEIYH